MSILPHEYTTIFSLYWIKSYKYIMSTTVSIDETNHQIISDEIRTISLAATIKEWGKLSKLSTAELGSLTGRSRIGCGILDRYFLRERLETRGNKGITFFEFLADYNEIYSKKVYIQNLIEFCIKNNRYKDSVIRRLYYCYGLCFGRVNAFKITNALGIYKQYNPKHILDPFCGFGGRCAAAMLMDIQYTGIDTNHELLTPYNSLISEYNEMVKPLANPPEIIIECANKVVYGETGTVTDYDMVLTSPPYDNIELYRNMGVESRTIEEWDLFFITSLNETV